MANPTAPAGTFLNREYIRGPGGVDELLCQYDWQRKPWFTLMDDGGDLVALCDRDSSTLRGRVAAEYTFDAYGQVLTAATYSNMSSNAHPHCGHKGLFVDRLDSPIVGSGNFENPRLAPQSTPLVQNRNRAYMPTLGRFVQQDPNETGLLTALSGYAGGKPATGQPDFELTNLYGNGLNLYQYLGSGTWTRKDPYGLEIEYYENVVLPLVSIIDDVIGPGVMSPLQDLYDGYIFIFKASKFFHEVADFQEDQVDWAVDWQRDDNEANEMAGRSPVFGGRAPAEELPSILKSPLGVGIPMAKGTSHGQGMNWAPIVKAGKRAERRARKEHNLAPCKHYLDGVDDNGKAFRRMHDGFRKEGKSHLFMEVKAGRQGLTQRVQTQINRDLALMRQNPGIKIKWVFYGKESEVSKELIKVLEDAGLNPSFGAR